MSELSIGDLAAATGTSVTTLRYYDEVDLIDPARRVGGKRRFDAATVGRVNFVRRCQAAGFSLNEIRDLLDDRRGHWRTLVDDKIDQLRQRRDELDQMIGVLGELAECGYETVADCPRVATG